jgi:predicted nucleic acid-binding protein
MLVLDTSAIVAVIDEADSNHLAARRFLTKEPGPFVVPTGILSEAAYMIESRVGPEAVITFLSGLERTATQLECGDEDMPRIAALCKRYSNLPLGFSDSAVIACAERLALPVLTYDSKHFDIVAKEGKLKRAK